MVQRHKRNLADKLFQGGLYMGKYVGAGAVALSLMGCEHVPKPISVSTDGRYIAYSANREGGLNFLDQDVGENAMVLYDTQKNLVVNSFLIDGAPIWPTNGNNTLAYMTTKEDSDFSSVVILTKDKYRTIERAAYPELSLDGRFVVYTKVPPYSKRTESKKVIDNSFLILREIASGRERNLGVTGLAADFSPDMKRLVYVGFETDGDDSEANIEVLNLLTGAKNRLGQANPVEGVWSVAYPRWLDDNKVVFAGKTKTGKDSEILVATVDGGLTQVTDNDVQDFLAGITKDGRVHYLTIDDEKLDEESSNDSPFLIDHDIIEPYIATQSIMGWSSKKSKVPVVKIVGDNAIFLGERDSLRITPVSNLEELDDSKIKNISETARRHVLEKYKTQQKLKDFSDAFFNLFRE
jgi:Tol biopolymer transport system component